MLTARETALVQCPEMFALNMQVLSDELGLPEITIQAEQSLTNFASEACDQARLELYGYLICNYRDGGPSAKKHRLYF